MLLSGHQIETGVCKIGWLFFCFLLLKVLQSQERNWYYPNDKKKIKMLLCKLGKDQDFVS